MKKLTIVIAILLCIVCFSGCFGENSMRTEEQESVKKQEQTVFDEITLLNTCEGTVNSLVATDALGRTLSAQTGTDSERYVGMFYFLWLGQEKMNGNWDITKALAASEASKGTAEEWDFWDGEIRNEYTVPNEYHFWGEPLFGYYNMQDPWVLKRHLEMLTLAGVDFLVFDTTNQNTYDLVWSTLLPLIEKFTEQGFNVPKVVFYTNTANNNSTSGQRISQLYINLYKQGKYKSTWFAPNGRPLIIGDKSQCSDEIVKFFEFRSNQWPGNPSAPDGFPWIDFSAWKDNAGNVTGRFLEVFGGGVTPGRGVVSVSVSQHASWPFSDSVQYKNSYYNQNWGRGYSVSGGNQVNKIDEGINFQDEWNIATTKANNPDSNEPKIDTVFVTGWNEWIAVKFYHDIVRQNGLASRTSYGIPDTRVFFVDQCTQEFSRDIEPMKGGHGDNYYIQLIDNIRKYKGKTDGTVSLGQKLTINVNGSIKQWESVTSSFRDFVGDCSIRNFRDAANNEGAYKDFSARNDISEIRLCYDDDNLYVMVSTADAITKHEQNDKTWMNFYIGVEGSSDPSFEGFQYLINRSPNGENTTIEKSKGGFDFETVGEAKYSVQGKYIQFAIPRAVLGLTSTENITLKIKATDHITHPEDIMDYYVSGDSAPIGRFGYSYKMN